MPPLLVDDVERAESVGGAASARSTSLTEAVRIVADSMADSTPPDSGTTAAPVVTQGVPHRST